jgi:DNA polymerase-3 subunit epsilon
MINAALERNGAPALRNRQIDTGLLVALLQSDGAFAAEPSLRGLSLDRLCALFDVVPYDRHTAPGDAFLTAQVFLRLMRLAARHGRRILAALVAEPATAPTPPGARAPSTL